MSSNILPICLPWEVSPIGLHLLCREHVVDRRTRIMVNIVRLTQSTTISASVTFFRLGKASKYLLSTTPPLLIDVNSHADSDAAPVYLGTSIQKVLSGNMKDDSIAGSSLRQTQEYYL